MCTGAHIGMGVYVGVWRAGGGEGCQGKKNHLTCKLEVPTFKLCQLHFDLMSPIYIGHSPLKLVSVSNSKGLIFVGKLNIKRRVHMSMVSRWMVYTCRNMYSCLYHLL